MFQASFLRVYGCITLKKIFTSLYTTESFPGGLFSRVKGEGATFAFSWVGLLGPGYLPFSQLGALRQGYFWGP